MNFTMKKVSQLYFWMLLCSICLIGSSAFAQAPESFNYQAVVRDNSGVVVANSSVGFRISIREGTPVGTVVYQETHTVITNSFGLVNFPIGDGTVVSGTFGTLNWGGTSHFVTIEIDPGSQGSYSLLGTQQLISVPYALHAKTVQNDAVNDADADPANELNTSMTLAGTDLELTDAGGTLTVDLSGLADNDADSTNEYNTGATLNGTNLEITDPGGTITVPLASLVDDADADPTNEIQTMTQSGNSVTLSNGGGTISVADLDNDPTNEYNTGATLSGNNLTITDGGGTQTVDLSALNNTGTDDQNLTGATLSGSSILTIDIENGSSATVDLSNLEETAAINQVAGDLLVHTAADNDLSSSNEIQSLALSGNDLTISGGNTVSLNGFVNTDSQTLSTSQSGTNRDITISNGNTITVSVADNDNSSTNEIQTISSSTSGTNRTLTLSNGGGSSHHQRSRQ